MHTVANRASVVIFFSLSTLFLCGCVCALSYYTSTTPASRRLEDVNISNIRVNYPLNSLRGDARGLEYALVEFDLKADLTSLWNWNVKQMLVSIVAHFVTPTHSQNAQVVWSRIINGTEAGPQVFNLSHTVHWEMPRPTHKELGMDREIQRLSAERGDFVGMNQGPEADRQIELRLQYELFPLIGSTFLGEVPNKSARFVIEPQQNARRQKGQRPA